MLEIINEEICLGDQALIVYIYRALVLEVVQLSVQARNGVFTVFTPVPAGVKCPILKTVYEPCVIQFGH